MLLVSVSNGAVPVKVSETIRETVRDIGQSLGLPKINGLEHYYKKKGEVVSSGKGLVNLHRWWQKNGFVLCPEKTLWQKYRSYTAAKIGLQITVCWKAFKRARKVLGKSLVDTRTGSICIRAKLSVEAKRRCPRFLIISKTWPWACMSPHSSSLMMLWLLMAIAQWLLRCIETSGQFKFRKMPLNSLLHPPARQWPQTYR